MEFPNINSSVLKSIESMTKPVTYTAPAINGNLASGFYKRLVEMINEFDNKLDPEHEVGARLVSYGQTVLIHIEDLGYYNPSLIRFYGRLEDGSKVELIQHVSQISFILMAVKRLNPDEPKKRIGFNVNEEVSE